MFKLFTIILGAAITIALFCIAMATYPSITSVATVIIGASVLQTNTGKHTTTSHNNPKFVGNKKRRYYVNKG